VNLLVESVGFGLVTAGIIALSATAFSLQYSVTSIPNFMHGEFLTASAYGMWLAYGLSHSLALSIVIGMAVGGLMAWAMDVVVIERFLKRRAPAIHLLVVSVTLGIALQAATSIFFGARTQVLPIPSEWQIGRHYGPLLLTDIDIAIVIVAFAAMFALHLVLRYTTFGKAQRAVADSKELASASGVPTRLIVQGTWFIVGVVAGLSGILLAATRGSFDPFFGFDFLLVTLAAAVVGGLGRPYGAMAGALIIGLVTEISGTYLNAGYKQVAALSVLIVVLMVRPSGILTALRESQLT
jgi:branched-subunit amino acid ABC-type transport system permease component